MICTRFVNVFLSLLVLLNGAGRNTGKLDKALLAEPCRFSQEFKIGIRLCSTVQLMHFITRLADIHLEICCFILPQE